MARMRRSTRWHASVLPLVSASASVSSRSSSPMNSCRNKYHLDYCLKCVIYKNWVKDIIPNITMSAGGTLCRQCRVFGPYSAPTQRKGSNSLGVQCEPRQFVAPHPALSFPRYYDIARRRGTPYRSQICPQRPAVSRRPCQPQPSTAPPDTGPSEGAAASRPPPPRLVPANNLSL